MEGFWYETPRNEHWVCVYVMSCHCVRGSRCVVNGSSAVAGISALLVNIHVLGQCSVLFGEPMEPTQRKIGSTCILIP